MSRHRFRISLVCCLCVLNSIALVRGDVKLPAVFSSHMVLQRDVPLPVWGWASPGEQVTVTFGDATQSATTDAQGKWKVMLPSQATSTNPREMVVKGKNELRLRDILVGEVWLGSGQSNMQWSVTMSANPNEEVAAANYPNIRLFQIPLIPSGTPAEDVDAKWQACSPKTIGPFSAVLYFFGRELHKDLDGVPLGLIQSAWGGTRIEPWIPPVGFEAVPTIHKELDKIKGFLAENHQAQVEYVNKLKAWIPQAEESLAAGKGLPAAVPVPKHPLNSNGRHTGLYNGMIHGIVPFAIKGAIWYQGESNLRDVGYYHELMKGLIAGWRKVWNNENMPFYFVQLAPFNYGAQVPSSFLAELWEAQTKTLSVPHTGMAVTTDIGNVKDIHPVNKQEVGRRLALWALAQNYGKKDLVYSGPLFECLEVEGNKARIKFRHAEGGLKSQNGQPLNWFWIAGDDKQFHNANAVIDGNSVVVSCDAVAKPAAVRFGWSQLAEPNLSNQAGLPASPFRTDDWTDGKSPAAQ